MVNQAGVVTAKAIRVLIVDDHAVVRAGLAKILGAESDITIVGEARDGLEAIEKAQELKPDVILMDIFMPRCSGLQATVAIRQKLPDARVLILTISEQEDDLFQALRFGAQGYLLKSATITEVADGVRMIASGEAMLSPHIVSRLVAELREKANEPALSTREVEVLQLLGEGLSNTEIANRLFIGESTVRTYLHRILDKLQLKNR
ncbi:MAG TPA: response regulator transcription factor, partial [Dehalococcoidia bacterium]|nr:response regulator transcription factor [Dehalococcoidia bacterium]